MKSEKLARSEGDIPKLNDKIDITKKKKSPKDDTKKKKEKVPKSDGDVIKDSNGEVEISQKDEKKKKSPKDDTKKKKEKVAKSDRVPKDDGTDVVATNKNKTETDEGQQTVAGYRPRCNTQELIMTEDTIAILDDLANFAVGDLES